jgi:hypothetical protein
MRFVSRNPFPLMVGLCCRAALISGRRSNLTFTHKYAHQTKAPVGAFHKAAGRSVLSMSQR